MIPARSFAPIGVAFVLAYASASWAQQAPTAPAGTAPAGGGGATTTYFPGYPGGIAPTAPGQPLGGGNATESSAHAVSGDQEDSFDLNQPGASGTGAAGSQNGPIFMKHAASDQSGMRPIGPPPGIHVVKKGDTLWQICGEYFANPYQWPRIWSYNPQIQNPHWIYPNEQVRLRPGAGLASVSDIQPTTPDDASYVEAAKRISPETVFLRDQGFVDDEGTLNWGSLVGAPEDKMFLSDTDEAYVRFGPEHDVKIGQELTVYRPVRKVSNGEVIKLQGTVRIGQWNPETRIARVQIVETLDAIERGARVGPVPRSFQVVPPVRNDADVTAHVAVAVHPHVFVGRDQVIFIDQGSDAGLKPGNRLFIVRRGDAWRQSMQSDETSRRIVIENEDPAAVEYSPKLSNDKVLPEEITGELRVLNVQKKSATCLVTRSKYEIELSDVAVARKGY